MKCVFCNDGYMEVVSSNYIKKGGIYRRMYRCRSCRQELETVEVSRKEYARQYRLLNKLNLAVSEYVQERKEGGL